MEKPLITSSGNPLIKQARALRQKKARLESGLFLVEGIHHVGEAIEAGWEIDSILYAPELLTSSFARDLISRLARFDSPALAPGAHLPRAHTRPGVRRQGVPWSVASAHGSPDASRARGPQPVSAQVMESLADKENPQGILAIVHQRQMQINELDPITTAAALVSPQDPGNVGTILRTMDAVGVDALFLLDGGVELYHPTVVRSSMGTLFWKPIIQTTFDVFAQWSRHGNYQLIGTSAHGDVDYQTLVPKVPWILVLGSEQKGLSAAQTKACDVTVSLPMKGRVSSLNLAVAAGILLYQYCVGQTGNLPRE
jgi:TrmH family RNA methyltransferase